jgi:hypothetical protein
MVDESSLLSTLIHDPLDDLTVQQHNLSAVCGFNKFESDSQLLNHVLKSEPSA